MTLVIIWDPVDRILWGVAITILFIAGLLYFNNGRKREIENERIIMYGFAGLLWSLMFYFLFICLYEIFIPGTFLNGKFYGSGFWFNRDEVWMKRKISKDLMMLYFMDVCRFFSWWAHVIFVILAFERIIQRTKYIFSIIFITNLVCMIFIHGYLIYSGGTVNIAPFYLNVIYIVVFIDFILNDIVRNIISIIVVYYLTKRSRLEFKAVPSIFVLGYIIFGNGSKIVMEYKESGVIPLFFAPILVIIGVIIILSPAYLNPKYFSQSLIMWKILGPATIGFYILPRIYFAYVGVGILEIDNLVICIALGLLTYFILRNIKSEMRLESKGRGKESYFTRPQKVTEEEVSVSKEKKICLVCKNELSRENYICPDCKTFYCTNCSKSLSDLENACWVCETPFDESKPVRLPEKKEEAVVVEDNIYKKVKGDLK